MQANSAHPWAMASPAGRLVPSSQGTGPTQGAFPTKRGGPRSDTISEGCPWCHGDVGVAMKC